MYAMTAAHKTLPLLSYAKVTNLKNHRSVIVRINDRGAFYGKRDMDLSYAAAKELGIRGIGSVEITPISRNEAVSSLNSSVKANKHS
jgi:rare lipoprotein A